MCIESSSLFASGAAPLTSEMAKISAKMEQLIFDCAGELFARCCVYIIAQCSTPTRRNGPRDHPTKFHRATMKTGKSWQ
jgi:hypothetical protein